jgi:hypothetical protein
VRVLSIFASVIALLAATVGPALATDSPDPLAATMLDVALIRSAPTTSNAPPDLLVVEPDDQGRARVKVRLIHRVPDAWLTVAETSVEFGASPDAPAPWLVELGEGRFALVSASIQGSSTDVVPLVVDPLGPDVQVEDRVRVDFSVTDAGAADVDGDGVNELVVSTRADSPCTDTTMAVFGGSGLEERRRWTLPHTRLAGAAVGEFDGRPGAELLAHAHETCRFTGNGEEPHSLLVIRLADGTVAREESGTREDQAGLSFGVPLVVDIDGDGRNEAIIRKIEDVVVLDPSHDWAASTLGAGAAIPLVAFDAPKRVVWLGDFETSRPVGVVAIDRGSDGRLAVSLDAGYSIATPVREGLETTFERTFERARTGRLPPAAVLDVDRDGCPDIVAPMVTLPCLGIRPLEPGPSWLATVPLAAYDGPVGGTILVALGLDWIPGAGNVTDPSPAAAAEPGLWRSGPSTAFVLRELPSALFGTHVLLTQPVVDTLVAPYGSLRIGAPDGARLLVRARPLTRVDYIPDPVPSPEGFLTDSEAFAATRFMTPPISAGGESTRSGEAFTTFDLRRLTLEDGTPATNWLLDVAVIDQLGNLAGPVRVVAGVDVTAPSITVNTPLLTPTWPLAATLDGHSEAGASVRLNDGAPVQADADGRFQVEAPLAPWPQSLEFTATDAYGNATVLPVSVMGGVDVRQLPWAPILTVTFLLGAFIASVRGGRRGAPTGVRRTSHSDEPPLPEIEEVSGGSPRD